MTNSSPSDLRLPPGAVYSVIVFDAGTTFPDLRFPPEGCYVLGAHRFGEAIDRILAREPVLSDAEVMEIAYEIRKHRIAPTKEVREAHIRDIQTAIGRDRVME
jgi:hypothetical protein